MKLNDNVISGIFKYIPGIEFTADDLLIYNKELYVVTTNFIGSNEILPSEYCKPYISYHKYSSSNQYDQTALLTTDTLLQFIHMYFKGIKLDGTLETVEVNTLTDLNTYIDTGAYQLLTKIFNPNNVTESYIIRVFKLSDTKSIQEILKLDGTYMILRSVDNGIWEQKFLPLNQSSDRTSQLIGESLAKLSLLEDKYHSLIRNQFNFRLLSIIDNPSEDYQYQVVIEEDDYKDVDYLILHLIILKDTDITINHTEQYPVDILINDTTMDTSAMINSLEVHLNCHEDAVSGDLTIDIQLINPIDDDSTYTLSSIYYSKTYQNT